jgi:hypothetical protein
MRERDMQRQDRHHHMQSDDRHHRDHGLRGPSTGIPSQTWDFLKNQLTWNYVAVTTINATLIIIVRDVIIFIRAKWAPNCPERSEWQLAMLGSNHGQDMSLSWCFIEGGREPWSSFSIVVTPTGCGTILGFESQPRKRVSLMMLYWRIEKTLVKFLYRGDLDVICLAFHWTWCYCSSINGKVKNLSGTLKHAAWQLGTPWICVKTVSVSHFNTPLTYTLGQPYGGSGLTD